MEFRLKRQDVLKQVDYEVVLDEAALQRVVGSPTIMREQLAHLLALSYRPNVSIQVHPFSAGALVSPDGAFTLLTLPAPFPMVVQVPTEARAMYMEAPQVTEFEAAYARLQAAALDADDSRTWIKSRMEQLA